MKRVFTIQEGKLVSKKLNLFPQFFSSKDQSKKENDIGIVYPFEPNVEHPNNFHISSIVDHHNIKDNVMIKCSQGYMSKTIDKDTIEYTRIPTISVEAVHNHSPFIKSDVTVISDDVEWKDNLVKILDVVAHLRVNAQVHIDEKFLPKPKKLDLESKKEIKKLMTEDKPKRNKKRNDNNNRRH